VYSLHGVQIAGSVIIPGVYKSQTPDRPDVAFFFFFSRRKNVTSHMKRVEGTLCGELQVTGGLWSSLGNLL